MKIGRLRLNKRHLIIILLAVIILGFFIYFVSFDKDILKNNSYSTTFYDKNGKTLRTFLSDNETYSKKCSLSETSPHFLRAIILIEDKRFYSHKGVMLSSIFRAFWQNLRERRIVSGGSTITMQLAKLLYDHKKRTILKKISEFFSAFKLEFHLSKEKILEEYLDRLPFGNMIYGVKEASHFYFEREPSELSLNQAIYLALIPKSPSRYNPKRHLNVLNKRWKKILEVFKRKNHITNDEYERAKREGIKFHMSEYPLIAPHFIDFIKNKYFKNKIPHEVHTTLDAEIQVELKGIIQEHLIRLKRYNVKSSAVVIIDNQTHEVIAFLGSPDYFNDKISGYVNLAISFRQPGSTLKPFVYGIALENGYTPSTILPDIQFPAKGGFFPKNHDGREHGPLRLRTALACSYNIPAFFMAIKLSPKQIINKLRLAGFTYLKDDPGFYGETIALGSGEIKLLDLVIAYSAFANKGEIYFPAFIKGEPVKNRRLFNKNVTFLIWDILSDPSARFASFGYKSSMNLPFPVAVKTGTSKGFRDKWAVGVNSLFTVGVWIGNPDGEDMADLSQVGSASTILRDIFLAIQKDWTKGRIEKPEGIVKKAICPISGELISKNCQNSVEEFFDINNLPEKSCTYHVIENGQVIVRYPEEFREWAIRNNHMDSFMVSKDKKKWISFPQNGDFFFISDAISKKDQQITFEVMGFKTGEKIEFYLNGNLFKRIVYPGILFWPLQRGRHTLSIRNQEKTFDSIKFRVM